VLFKGQPADGATVVFTPEAGNQAGALLPSGKVQSDGTFKLQTYPHGEGAPPGNYKVTVTWLPADAIATGNRQNKAPAKFGSTDTSPLTAVVKEEPTTLSDFDLSK
jgi:hypothetical protein